MAEPIGDPFIVLMERTIANLVFIELESQKRLDPLLGRPSDLFEVTQTINSFLGVLVMPWDRVLKTRELDCTSNKYEKLKSFGFPKLESSMPLSDKPAPNLGAMLRAMRNGAAHGGVTLLNLSIFRERRPAAPLPMVQHNEIAAVEIESRQDMGKGPREWGCILSVDEMRQFLGAMVGLSRNEQFILPDVWRRHQKALEYHRGRRTEVLA